MTSAPARAREVAGSDQCDPRSPKRSDPFGLPFTFEVGIVCFLSNLMSVAVEFRVWNLISVFCPCTKAPAVSFWCCAVVCSWPVSNGKAVWSVIIVVCPSSLVWVTEQWHCPCQNTLGTVVFVDSSPLYSSSCLTPRLLAGAVLCWRVLDQAPTWTPVCLLTFFDVRLHLVCVSILFSFPMQENSGLPLPRPVFCLVCSGLPGSAVNSYLWLLQRRGVAGKGVEGGVEMESTGDEQCCGGLHHHHHHHHHHHPHHHHDLHEDSLGSDSSLGAQSDLSEDSTQVRLLTRGCVACMCPTLQPFACFFLCSHPAMQSNLLWATLLTNDQLHLTPLVRDQVYFIKKIDIWFLTTSQPRRCRFCSATPTSVLHFLPNCSDWYWDMVLRCLCAPSKCLILLFVVSDSCNWGGKAHGLCVLFWSWGNQLVIGTWWEWCALEGTIAVVFVRNVFWGVGGLSAHLGLSLIAGSTAMQQELPFILFTL